MKTDEQTVMIEQPNQVVIIDSASQRTMRLKWVQNDVIRNCTIALPFYGFRGNTYIRITDEDTPKITTIDINPGDVGFYEWDDPHAAGIEDFIETSQIHWRTAKMMAIDEFKKLHD